MRNVYDFTVNTLEGESCKLRQFAKDVLLIVNVASLCRFTPQYKALEKLYRQFHSQGFQILAFPCNQFGKQEPGNEKTIQAFCDTTYHITFPVFAKIHVNGPATHPLYTYLKEGAPGIFGTKSIKWNFTKFLIDRQGQVIKRFAPLTCPSTLAPWIETALHPKT